MPTPRNPESTTFTIDALGRYICNGLDEVRQSVSNGGRPFDVIVIGGGSFGAIVAERVLFADATRSHRVLILEADCCSPPLRLPEPSALCSACRLRCDRLMLVVGVLSLPAPRGRTAAPCWCR